LKFTIKQSNKELWIQDFYSLTFCVEHKRSPKLVSQLAAHTDCDWLKEDSHIQSKHLPNA